MSRVSTLVVDGKRSERKTASNSGISGGIASSSAVISSSSARIVTASAGMAAGVDSGSVLSVLPQMSASGKVHAGVSFVKAGSWCHPDRDKSDDTSLAQARRIQREYR